ncbi:MAG: M13 family metallopeptidase [Bacteroidetes bacterium]|nr:M13 family metallopeptidase [Bacteroidota bacterium]
MKYLLAILLCCTLLTAQTKRKPPLDTSTLDRTVAPCDDFYHFANGSWLLNNPIPPEFSMWGSFNELNEKNAAVLKQILEESASDTRAVKGSNRRKLGDLYASGMDVDRIEKLGVTPLKEDMLRISRIENPAGIRKEIALHHTMGIRTLFRFSADQDEKESKSVIAQLAQGGLGLPDRDYYLAADERSQSIRNEYRAYMTTMFILAGDDTAAAEEQSEAVMEFETRLANASFTRVQRRDPDKNYNKMSVAELTSRTPGMDWEEYFRLVNAPQVTVVNAGQPPFLTEAALMIDSVDAADWRAYFRWKVLSAAAPALSAPFVAEHFRFTGTILTGAKEMQPRWKRVLASVNGAMGEALGEQFVLTTFSPKAKQKARIMVDNIIAAFSERIDSLPWMDAATRAAAQEKLASFSVKIGYTDKWEDYGALVIDRSSYLQNIRRGNALAFAKDVATIGKPVDREKWGMTPQTVNAYYNANLNEIVFPAAILQPPFYDPAADDALNYGGIGAVIGHELTHGFDDQGSKYDAEGNLRSWWSEATRKQFDARVAQLEAQFNGYTVLDSLHVNGKLTSGENIADLGGLAIAYAALQKELDKQPNLYIIDDFTPGQRFFLAWARVWRRNYRDEALRLQVRTDPHSPAMFRTNGPLSNMQEFFDAFECESGMLYRTQEQRVVIW